jgi:hypothetical protein
MATPLMEVFRPTNLRVSLPEDLEDAFHSLPGIGILSADQKGDKAASESGWGAPSLQITLPRKIDRAKVDEVFEGSGIPLYHARNAIGRNTVMFYQHGSQEWGNDSDWWLTILQRLRKLTLPDFAPIGPFDVFYLWVTDQSLPESEIFALKIADKVSHIGVTINFDVIGGELSRLEFACENLQGDPNGIEHRVKDIAREHPLIAYEKYESMGFDQIVDMIMQLSENINGFPWSREEVRLALMKALHRCVQFAG